MKGKIIFQGLKVVKPIQCNYVKFNIMSSKMKFSLLHWFPVCVRAHTSAHGQMRQKRNKNPYLPSEQIRLLFPALNQEYFSIQQSNTNHDLANH
jgi:hypothetical protein